MDNVELEVAKCPICGKEFNRPRISHGRKLKYCSDECRKEKHKELSNRYNKKRFKSDAEWRAHKRSLNNKSAKNRLIRKKNEAFLGLVDELYQANSREEVAKILEEKVRLRRELYN